MYKFFRSNTLLCFSPAVMIGTIIIELALAAFVIIRYVSKSPQRIIVALLVFLAAFQLAEFNVCATSPANLIWSRLGYSFITMLPPLGIHLAVQLRREYRPWLVYGSYGAAAILIAAFAFLPEALNTGVCTGNYVIFLLQQRLSAIYGLYYFGFELVGLMLGLTPPSKLKSAERVPLYLLAAGYVSILIPTLIIYYILPAADVAVPSVMCGFAVIMAIILGGLIAPRISKAR